MTVKTQIFGATAVGVATIGQGTWNLDRASRDAGVRAIHRGIELGMTHIDTAEMYGSGSVERVLAEALAGRREQAFLVSKVLPQNANFKGTIAACEGSLRRLQTHYLDCYLLHWLEDQPMEETFEAFAKLRDDGKIRSWGVSNFSLEEMKQAVSIVGENQIACNQVEYNLHKRTIEKDLMSWCTERSVAVVAYSPFGDKSFPNRIQRGGRVLAKIARDHSCSMRAVALRFLLRHENLFVIPKSTKIKHIEDNAAASSLNLSDEQLQQIDAAF